MIKIMEAAMAIPTTKRANTSYFCVAVGPILHGDVGSQTANRGGLHRMGFVANDADQSPAPPLAL